MKKLIILASMALVSLTASAQISVTWGNSNEESFFKTASGAHLADGSLVQLGFFAADTDFTTQGTSLSYLTSKFTSYATAFIGDGGYAGSGLGAFTKVSAVSALNTKLYYWVFDAPTALASTQWGVVTAANWTTPASAPDVLIIDLGQATAPSDAKVGSLATTGEFRTLVVSAIPEPSSYAAIAGLGILGFAASRRRRVA